MNQNFFYITWLVRWLCVAYLGNTWSQDGLWEEGKPAEVFCWENLGPTLHVDVTLTHTTSLSVVADHAHRFMENLF